jgi:hypothetical protein
LPDRSLDRIRRFDELISTCERHEESHVIRRGTILYLGDTLAFRLLPEHYVKVLCRNDRPGFFTGKKGRVLEMQATEFVVRHGDRAVLHDLTHCLRIGDLSFVKEGSPPVTAEFGTAWRYSLEHERRKARQHRRLELAARVLGEAVEKKDLEDLSQYGLPTGVIELDVHFHYHVEAFVEASRIGSKGYTIVHPEEGLAYIATAPDCPPSEYMPQFTSEVRPGAYPVSAAHHSATYTGRHSGEVPGPEIPFLPSMLT